MSNSIRRLGLSITMFGNKIPSRILQQCGGIFCVRRGPVGVASMSRSMSALQSVLSTSPGGPAYPTPRGIRILQFQQHRSIASQSQNSSQHEELSQEEEEEGYTPYLVYEGFLKSRFKHIKILSLLTSVAGLAMQPVILSISQSHGMVAMIALSSMVGFFTFVNPFLIHMLAKRYVTDIIYDPKEQLYTAVTYSFFLQRKEMKFRKDDVTVPDVPGMFTTALVKPSKEGKPVALFFALESFIYPNHFGLLMGYDKPLDLHISHEDVQAAVDDKKKTKDENN